LVEIQFDAILVKGGESFKPNTACSIFLTVARKRKKEKNHMSLASKVD
jgi:hypothetical protein